MRPETSGRNIIIKNPDDFGEWLDTDEAEGTDESNKGFFI